MNTFPVRPLPSVSRRLLLGASLAAAPLAALGAPQIASADPVAPVDPAVTGGETQIVDVTLADVAPTADPDGPLRRIEDIAATMVGCTWTGAAPDHVLVRGRDKDGVWTRWMELEEAVNPETGGAEPGTEPVWLGGSFAIDVRAVRGGEDVASELIAHVVTTSPRTQDAGLARASVGAGVGSTGRVGLLGAIASTPGSSIGPNAPTIITRAQWGADESRVGGVSTASEIHGVVIHHTEGSNTYSQAESAQQVRGILDYHTRVRGWADIGYNFLVDRYGQVFEARHGGMTKNVIGAHVGGFNTGTVGISVMGSFTASAPPQVAIDAALSVATWKMLGTMLTDPWERTSYTGGAGATKYKDQTVSLPRLLAHRDIGSTDCPGGAFYDLMNNVRNDVRGRIGRGWRVHLDAYNAAGGREALGTVTEVAHPEGDYIVTILTGGIILSEGSSDAVGYPSSFASAWQPSWGRPLDEPTSASGTTTQLFENGTARRTSSGVTFTEGSPIPNGPVPDGVYSVGYASTLFSVRDGNASALTGAQWAAMGYPQPTRAATDYVRYSWSDAIVAVTRWGATEGTWSVEHLDGAAWARAGSPRPRVASYVPRSSYISWATDPGAIFVRDANGVARQLTYSQWVSHGRPAAELQNDQGFQKLSWDPAIARMTSIARGQGGPIDGGAWASFGWPAPQAVMRFPGDQIYWGKGGDIWYAGPTVNRRLTYTEWRALGSPNPAPAMR